MTTHILTQDELKTQLHYNPETGIFTRKVVKSRRKGILGKTGYINKDGYLEISVNCIKYKAHRLAWLYVTGYFPANHLDHINGDRSDNRYENLREATWKQNNQNRRKSVGKFLLGVKLCRNKFQARICLDRIRIHLGTFDTEELAHDAYLKAKRELHEFCTI
jgi:hypothetical protein